MLCILGSFTCGVDRSCNKVSGWTQLTVHVEHLSGISTVSNKSSTSFHMNSTVTGGKSFMSRSCPCWLETNTLPPIKILTPLRLLLMVISTRPCYRWCCLVEDSWAMWPPGWVLTVMQYLLVSLQAASQRKRYGGQAMKTYVYLLA